MPEAILSTMWSVGRHPRFEDFLEQACAAGFGRFELNYELPPEWLEAVRRSGAVVTSVHAPCPKTEVRPGIWRHDLSLSSMDSNERQEAINSALDTIDLAAELGARAVVVHLGGIPEAKEAEQELRRLYADPGPQSPAYLLVREQLLKLRAANADMYVESALESLTQLHERAREQGVRLGLECRYHAFEIPNLSEMALFLREFDDHPSTGSGLSTVGYWHDVGHAEVLDRLGFASHEGWLQGFAPRLVGMHLHDVEGLRDHRAAGSGDLPWERIVPHLPLAFLPVCEFAGWNEPQAVAAGLRFLQEKGIVSR